MEPFAHYETGVKVISSIFCNLTFCISIESHQDKDNNKWRNSTIYFQNSINGTTKLQKRRNLQTGINFLLPHYSLKHSVRYIEVMIFMKFGWKTNFMYSNRCAKFHRNLRESPGDELLGLCMCTQIRYYVGALMSVFWCVGQQVGMRVCAFAL